MVGPAFAAAIAYVDPGNFATNFAAGSHFGYRLLWVVVAANLVGMLVQTLSAKLGLATGRNLAEVCRERYPRPVVWAMWVQAELVAMATDLAEVIGGAVALSLIFGLPLAAGGVLVTALSFVLLAVDARGRRKFEAVVAGALACILVSFGWNLMQAGVPFGDVASGMLPGLPNIDSVLLAGGLVGATVMPHVVYVHSDLTSSHVTGAAPGAREPQLRREETFLPGRGKERTSELGRRRGVGREQLREVGREHLREVDETQPRAMGQEQRREGEQEQSRATGQEQRREGDQEQPRAMDQEQRRAMDQEQRRAMDQEQRRRLAWQVRLDVFVALAIAGLANAVMLIVAARLFHSGPFAPDTLEGIHAGLGALLGGGAALAFALALLASGLASASVGTYAGQVVMAGFIRRSLPTVLRRLLTVLPALAVLVAGVDPTQALIWSQLTLSFGIPFVLIPLIGFTRDRKLMGPLVNSRVTTAVAGSVAGIVVALNVVLAATVVS